MSSTKINLPRILFVSASLALIIIYVLSWVEVITNPMERTASDFMAFYAAGRGTLQQTWASAYDLHELKIQEENVLGFQIADRDVNPFVHPPFILTVLWLTAHFKYVTAFYLWAGFMLGVCGLCSQIAAKMILFTETTNRLAVWFGVLLFFPLFISLVNGQDSALLLLGVLLWYYGLTQNSDRMAGLGLALTTIRPQIALVLAIPFLFNATHRKVWWWFCGGAGILATFSILLIGVDGVRNFLSILSVSASGEGYKINEIDMVNLIGMVKRIVPSLGASTTRVIGWSGNLIGLIVLCWMWWKAKVMDDRYISLAVIIAAFTSPHLHYHDLALLVVPLLIAVRGLIATKKIPAEYAVLISLGISLILALTYSIRPLMYPIIYLLEAALLITPWWLAKSETVETSVKA